MQGLGKNLAAFFTALLLCNSFAYADPVPGLVGGQGGDGSWIEFYIPLDGVVYGTGSPGTCYTGSLSDANDCDGGELHLFMDFAIDWTGQTLVDISFLDLDHPGGFGDNSWFSELLEIVVTDVDGDMFNFDLAVIAGLLTGGQNAQFLSLDLDLSGSFGLEFIFTSHFGDVYGRFYNTPEYLRAAARGVPEPGTLALLGAGLLVLAFSRRRRRVSPAA